ncbi:MAG: class I SAM-dependent methyltransferase [Cyanobacteria bacterium P01_A01_bin.105]
MNAIADRAITGVINGLLAVKPLATFAKHRARTMMIERAESIGVFWRDEAAQLKMRGQAVPEGTVNSLWNEERQQLTDAGLIYPDYYLTSFHAYDEGNLGWQPAMEVGVAARAVHARLWPEGDKHGDERLRASYHNVLTEVLPDAPQRIVDLGCSTGLSTFALRSHFPQAHITGIDLSPYFLAVAQHQTPESGPPITWKHAAAEATGLPDGCADFVSICLVFHELPQQAALAVLTEARRLLRPGGHLGFMDMNPQSQVYAQMPPYILTLLKSTEPYLDQYFALDLPQAMVDAGFEKPVVTFNTARHRTLVAKAV